MPKYWVKNYFAHGSFPEVGQKQKTEKKKKRRERLNNGNNNDQATHGARKHAWRTQARKAPGPKNLLSPMGVFCFLWQAFGRVHLDQSVSKNLICSIGLLFSKPLPVTTAK